MENPSNTVFPVNIPRIVITMILINIEPVIFFLYKTVVSTIPRNANTAPQHAVGSFAKVEKSTIDTIVS